MDNNQSNNQAPQNSAASLLNQQQAIPEKNTVGLVGFIFSIVAIVTSLIPFVDFVIWATGAVCSIIGLFKNPKGFAIAGTIISFIGIVILIIVATIGSALFAGSTY